MNLDNICIYTNSLQKKTGLSAILRAKKIIVTFVHKPARWANVIYNIQPSQSAENGCPDRQPV